MHDKKVFDKEPDNKMVDELFKKARNNVAITFNLEDLHK